MRMDNIFGDIPYWCIGSLVLGCVRENGFIKNEHEFDYIIHKIDFNKLVERLKKLGKVEISSEGVDNNIVLRPIDNTNVIRIIKFYLDGVPIDIDIGFKIGDFLYYIVKGDEYKINKFPKKMFEKMAMTKFEGGIYPMPNKPFDYVEAVYDKDWNIVKSNWSCVIDPPCIIRDKKETERIMNMIIRGEVE